MKKNFQQIQSLLTALFLSIFLLPVAQGQDLLISEVLTNPGGNDSPFEFVEMVATKSINFVTTPYSVVFTNNGTATTNGWKAGGSVTYGFNITTGSVNKGDIVYVGGSSMTPTGTKLRVINTGTTGGDGSLGNANSGGVLGNGGANADAVAVFNLPIASVTSTTVPVDAIFFGTGQGTAVVSGGTAGYQLPVNDKYNGGKLQTTSYFAPDPASDQYLVATGVFDTITQLFTTPRTWANTATFTNNASSVVLGPAPGSVAFTQTHSIFNEDAGTATFQLTLTSPNSAAASVDVEVVASGTATGGGTDYTFATQTVTFPASTGGNTNVSIAINDDAIAEAAEYIYLRLTNPVNATIGSLSTMIVYIKDNDTNSPTASNELSLQLLGSYSNGVSGTNSSEISDYDSISHRIFIANSIGAKLDIIDISNPSQITSVASVSMAPYGNINAVAVKNGIVAAAIENASPQSPGKVVFFDTNGNYIADVTVGAMPDMITFNHAGTKIYTANEGEPNAAYTSDPEGSVSVVDISMGVGSATVTTIGFTGYNGQEAALRAQGIRIYGLNASVAQDFEPEYITIAPDDQTAWVNLQENNAVAVLNLNDNTISQLMPLGYKDLSLPDNSIDVSDVTTGVVMANWPIKGMYLPDELSSFTLSGTTYLVMANEGDSRAYTGFNEETSIGAAGYVLDATTFPQASYLKSNFAAGKLKVTNKLGDTDNDGDFDEIYAFGGRSFSIINGSTGARVYDSGDDIEQITANDPVFSAIFNANNSASNTAKNRSDDKGPEPEGVAVSQINGSTYAFIGLERIGGVMVFNVNDPANPQFVTYANNRSVVTSNPDRGVEGIKVISAAASPTGQTLVILSNEVSSTLTVYALCGSGGTLQTYYADNDGDTYGSASQTTQACATPTGYVADNTDCNDTNAAINPGATEICNSIDDDCDNATDESGPNVFYADADGDGYGDATATTQACTAPSGYVTDNTDCNDALAAVNPGATEVCNTIDDDCDTVVDEGVQTTFYADADNDGYGDIATTTLACTAPSGYVADNTDCDDGNAAVNPDETEICNTIDDDCDGLVDEGVQLTFYVDSDSDGYGSNVASSTLACTAPNAYVADNTDCNDGAASVNPGATEICNFIDDNCNTTVDEGVQTTFYADADSDGYGNSAVTTLACTAPSGYITNNTDCNDQNALVNPGVAEVCNNSTDDNCNGTTDEDAQYPAIYFNSSAFLPGITGPNSSSSPYLIPKKSGVQFKSILSVGDVAGSYAMCGIPDGLGAFDNGDGTFTVLMNHEIGNTLGATRAHGSIGSFVSKWVINKSNLSVVSGSDLMQTLYLWNTGTNSFIQGTTAFSRFCSADLPPVSAFYNSATGKGTPNRIFMNGEESGVDGRAVGHIASGPSAGVSYQLPYLGKFAWENVVASPSMSDKTVVGGMDDGTGGQVYFYVGTKTNTGTDIDKAGLNNGKLYGVQVTGMATETSGSTPASGTRFSLVDLGFVQNMTGTALNTASVNAGVTTFLRPEDGAWDPSNLNDFYFATTNAFNSPSRLWRLRFDDATNPETGGTVEAVLNGTEGQQMMDNLGIDQNGHILLQEDVGNNAHLGKLWQYTTATDAFEMIAQHDSTRFVTGAANFLTQDEESSGIIDVSEILGPGMFLLDVQAHYSIPGQLVEGGQLLALFNGASYSENPIAADTIWANTNTGCTATGVNLGTPGAWDNCTVASVTNDAPSAFPLGATTVTWTVTDGNGNSVTGTQIVIVTLAPGTIETCNNIDDDCDNLVDEGVQTTFYADADSDGYGNSAVTTLACTAPSGYVADNTDCDDAAAAVNPGATEICSNGIDDNCAEGIDEGCTVYTFYADADGDTYGNPAIAQTSPNPAPPSGYVTNSDDCNDTNAAINPGAAEVCNNIDDNCNGQIDEGVNFTYYKDADNDTYGNPLVFITSCSATVPATYRTNNLDCNDASAAIKPSATETCNSIDDNCNGIVDDIPTCPTNVSKVASAITSSSATIGWSSRPCAVSYQYRYRTYTSATVFGPWIGSSDPDGWISTNDTTIVLTGLTPATKYQYSVRNVCVSNFGTATAGKLFTTCTLLTFYQDLDADGYGNNAVSQTLECVATLAGWKTVGGDCNDNVATVKPGATEACNGVDDNCDGIVDNVTACPTNVSKVASNIGSSTATIGWSFRACAYSYQFRVRTYTSATVFGPWIGSSDPDGWITTTDTSTVLSGLTPNTKYQYSMRNVCYNNFGNATAGKFFTTCIQYTFYQDADGDGKGRTTPYFVDCIATAPSGYVTNSLDCNDAEPLAWTGNTEVCSDGVDNDCDGNVDNAIFYADADGDGFGDATMPLTGCPAQSGYVANATDCNDADATIKPGATELCDNIDNNCNGIVDDVTTCPKPVANATTAITSNSATISWTALPCAVNGYEYRIRFKVGGVYGAYSAYIPVATNSVDLTGLLPGTTYQYGVRTKCYGVNKYSVTTTAAAFTTLAGSALIGDVSYETIAPQVEIETGYEVAIYPNPTSGRFTTDITAETGGDNLEITVTDGLGRLLQQNQITLVKGSNPQEIDLTAYPDAIYFIELRTDKGIVHYPVVKSNK